jgi:serine/threonine protein kinase
MLCAPGGDQVPISILNHWGPQPFIHSPCCHLVLLFATFAALFGLSGNAVAAIMLTQWWDTARIEATVTRPFVSSKLLPDEIERLDRSLAFGDGLTDGTYWEWIDTKAKRIFLILVELGIPDQIFGIIDDSWDDGDLPIALDQVEQLALRETRDEKIEKRFYQRQFYYLLKLVEKGQHLVYQDHEPVPIDVVERRPGLSQNHVIDKVRLPNRPGQFFCRRRIPIGGGPGYITEDGLRDTVNSSKGVQNEHVVSYWASYVSQGYGYVLFTPYADTNLKNLLATTPTTFKNLSKKARRLLVMNWILCLVDTLACLHNKRQAHGNIKPSTILFNNENHIFYSDFNRLSVEALFGPSERAGSQFDRESYDYAAPEQWFRPTSGPTSPPTRKATLSSSPEFNIAGSQDSKINTPSAMLKSENPSLSPEPADVFSLGCVILEMLTFLMKKTTKQFATHRSAKHKTPGRGGAVLDASFHKNLGQVETWMGILAKEAMKKTSESDGGAVFKGVTPMLHIVTRMLSASPLERPAASEVQHQIYRVLTECCDISEPHCVHDYHLEYAFSQMRVYQGVNPNGETMSVQSMQSSQSMQPRRPSRPTSGGYSTSSSSRPLAHQRYPSSGGLSNSGSSTASSDRDTARDRDSRDRETGDSLARLREVQVPGKVRQTAGGWQSPPAVYNRGDQSVY